MLILSKLADTPSTYSCTVNSYTYFLSVCAALSGFLFGYDTGVISGALVNIGTDIGGQALTTTEKEWVASATSCGALVSTFRGGDRGGS